jgi:hypothetical protein
MKYLLLKHGRVVTGNTRYEAAVAAGLKLVDRQITINGTKYHTYGESYTHEEMLREAGCDAIRVLVKNHGWTLYVVADWRNS